LILVDTNVLLDVLESDSRWAAWSERQLEAAAVQDRLCINPVGYAELSVAFARLEELDAVLAEAHVTVEDVPREALFLAGKAFLAYLRRGGLRRGVLPDFFIGAHAAVASAPLLTRDMARYRTYFPTVELLGPQ
jgi:predicted nucleic acid-binding protein